MKRIVDRFTKHFTKRSKELEKPKKKGRWPVGFSHVLRMQMNEKLDRTKHLKEIFKIFKKLAKKDQRFGQIMCNLSIKDIELFYMENDEFLKHLKDYYEVVIK